MQSHSGSGARALVVDDDEALLRVHARALTKHGYTGETATDGIAALAAFERGSFDVIVSDIDMPGMDGIQFLKRARSSDPDVPVVLLTGTPRWTPPSAPWSTALSGTC